MKFVIQSFSFFVATFAPRDLNRAVTVGHGSLVHFITVGTYGRFRLNKALHFCRSRLRRRLTEYRIVDFGPYAGDSPVASRPVDAANTTPALEVTLHIVLH